MKTILSLLFTVTIAALVARADAPPPACCAAKEVQVLACCAKAEAVATATTSSALSGRSLYQLNSTWTTDHGVTLQLAAFRGRPVVVAMFFAQCEYACPMIVSDMQRVRTALPAEVRANTAFLLVTFDSERDTVAALHAYRNRYGLDDHWTLIRADAANVQDLAMLLGVKFKQDARGQFAHSNLITVLNAEGEIAHQRAGLQGDVSELVAAVAQLTPSNVHSGPR
ncbi:MAG: SCO family protein [Opitutus sp.]